MSSQLRQFLVYWVPLFGNVCLVAYLVWQLGYVPPFDRHTGFQLLSVLYAAGGIIVGVSGVAAFLQATSRDKGPRGLYALSLLNTIIPTVLVLVTLNLA